MRHRNLTFGRNGSAGGGGGLNFLTSRDATSQNATNMQDFFNTIGVNLSTGGRSVAYNDGLGLLFVKATPGELDTVGRVVQVLNQTATNASAMVTQTFPLRFADAGNLVAKLGSSVSAQATIEANSAGNAIIITDTRANIQHLSQMIDSLDVPPRPAVTNAPIPQPEFLTRSNAFSTFSMNVSDVSFKLAQASLQKGQMPDPASIRSEEFINAFNYRDPEAAAGQPMAFAYGARPGSVRVEPRFPAVLHQDGGVGTAGGPGVERGAAAGHVRLDGARRPRGDHPRGVAGAGGAVAAAGHGERGHLRAHGAPVGGRHRRRQGGRDAEKGRRHHARRRHESRRSHESRLPNRIATLSRQWR